MSLVFYDTETTGTETFFDQILQFAAIRTDEDFNELDRFEIRCRLLPHVVPAPGAMRVTGARVSKLGDLALPSHYEMVRTIATKLRSWSPSSFVGWNSIRFDEELLRQALYKTLHNPYLTNSDGNSRTDAMRIVQACSMHAPNALAFPTDAYGQKTFRLDQVAPANGFSHDRAHDAMGDVKATLFLCRLLNEKAPDIWSSFMRFSTKSAVTDFIGGEAVFCLSDFYSGNPYAYLVTTIGQNRVNKAEWYVYDLSVDPKTLLPLSDAQLAIGLGESPKPVRKVKSNAAPMLCAAEDAPAICNGRNYDSDELLRRAALVHPDTAFGQRLVSTMESLRKEYPRSAHIEKQIYDGFLEKPDLNLMEDFHEAPWPERLAVVERFNDPRLRAIGTQLVHLEWPELLAGDQRRRLEIEAAKRLLGQVDDVAWVTLPRALREIEAMMVNASATELELLQEHKNYLLTRQQGALACLRF